MLLARVRPNEPLSTAPLRGVFTREDAWLQTGDLFTRDSDGDYWRIDGVTDVIHTADGPVFTGPIRNALGDLPAVDLAVAYGVEPQGSDPPTRARGGNAAVWTGAHREGRNRGTRAVSPLAPPGDRARGRSDPGHHLVQAGDGPTAKGWDPQPRRRRPGMAPRSRQRPVFIDYRTTLRTIRSMSGTELGLAVSVFLACAVEAVEALTIVLAVGYTRSWRSTFTGVGAAVVLLAAVTAALGPALTSLPINALRVAVGGLLLIFGLQWLRKAILRAAGLKALHDEREAFQQEQSAAREAGEVGPDFDGYSFLIAFKGVFLEGLEVVFIVLTFGANQHDVGLAAAAAGAAVLAVIAAGVAIHAPLARVPENTMKFAVGTMLTSFGIFWGAEGAGVHWPGGDAALLVIVPVTAALALGLVALVRRRSGAAPLAREAVSA